MQRTEFTKSFITAHLQKWFFRDLTSPNRAPKKNMTSLFLQPNSFENVATFDAYAQFWEIVESNDGLLVFCATASEFDRNTNGVQSKFMARLAGYFGDFFEAVSNPSDFNWSIPKKIDYITYLRVGDVLFGELDPEEDEYWSDVTKERIYKIVHRISEPPVLWL